MNRPKRSGKDRNHYIPRNFMENHCDNFSWSPKAVRGSSMAYTANFEGVGLLLIDLSNYGGVLPDWHIETSLGTAAWLEMKDPSAFSVKNHELLAGELKPGEKWLMDNCHIPLFIIETEHDFYYALKRLLKGKQNDEA